MSRIKNFFKVLTGRSKTSNYAKKSYSQTGEDIIVHFIFQLLRIDKPSYLDLGAHHPQYLSNTFFFYETGCRGVNVEPDPILMEEFFKIRKEDKNLNVGIGVNSENEKADFYIMSARTLNTFSKEEAEKNQSYGTHKIEQVIKIPLVSINEIIKEHFSVCPNFVSIDVEGLDFEILKSIQFDLYRPEVFCLETITYSEDNTGRKLTEIINYLCSKDYFVFADTYINTIFVDNRAWQKR